MVDYTVITEEEWGNIPGKPTRAPDELDRVIDELERGNIVRLTAADEKDLRGKRLTIGRRATKRGFKVEIRTQDLTIAVRRKDEASAAQPAAEPKKRGRKRRPQQEAEVVAGSEAP